MKKDSDRRPYEKQADIGEQKVTTVKRSDVVGTPSKNPNKDGQKADKNITADTDSDNNQFIRTKKLTVRGLVHSHILVNTIADEVIGENPQRNSLFLRNLSPTTVWIGESGLIPGLDGNGFPLKEDDVLNLDGSYGSVWAAVEAGTAVLALLEE